MKQIFDSAKFIETFIDQFGENLTYLLFTDTVIVSYNDYVINSQIFVDFQVRHVEVCEISYILTDNENNGIYEIIGFVFVTDEKGHPYYISYGMLVNISTQDNDIYILPAIIKDDYDDAVYFADYPLSSEEYQNQEIWDQEFEFIRNQMKSFIEMIIEDVNNEE